MNKQQEYNYMIVFIPNKDEPTTTVTIKGYTVENAIFRFRLNKQGIHITSVVEV